MMEAKAKLDLHCIINIENLFWRFKDFDIYRTPMCRMHMADHGIFLRLFSLIENKLDSKGKWTKELDYRFKHLKYYPFHKTFHNGVFNLKSPSAAEHRQISVCLPFMLNGLDNDQLIDYIEATVIYLKWRQLLSYYRINEKQIKELEILGKQLQKKMLELSDAAGKDECKINSMPKVKTFFVIIQI